MAVPIQGITPILTPAVTIPAAPSDAAQHGAFSEIFRSTVQNVQALQDSAHQNIDQFLSGQSEDLHKVALATQKAELNFDMFLQVRNKVVQAYQEIMRMQV